MRALYLVLFLFTALPAKAQRTNDTLSVYFDLDVPELNEKATTTIDSLFYLDKISRVKPLSIIGYADYLAHDEYNLELSRKRAENVKAYLLTNGLDDKKINLLVGRGEVKRKDTVNKVKGVPSDRRVDIVVIHQPVTKRITDTFIVMKPGDKVAIPPSSSDPDFDIDKIPEGKTFILKNIYFPMGRHFPKKNSYDELNMLLEAMKENPRLRIQIEGHVCCISDFADAYDLDSRQLDLSLNRARFIYEYLKQRGIAENRLTYKGFGKSRPIVKDEQTAEEAAMNRRVEIRILSR
ncbi:MAG: OmpA family protein [Sphingobacteriales bacterium]|nr:MAG: OmpA family protein [Sphingobacteriales bacterium]